MFKRYGSFLMATLVPLALVSQEVRVSSSSRPESEVSAAASPADPSRLIAAAVHDVSDSPGTADSRLSVYYSSDAGQSWRRSAYDGLAGPETGIAFIGDPVLAFDRAGRAHLSHLRWSRGTTGEFIAELWLATSVDGGESWSPRRLASSGAGIYDKPWLICDRSDESPYRDRLYLSYTYSEAASGTAARRYELFLLRLTAGDDAEPPEPPVRIHRGEYEVVQFSGLAVDRRGRLLAAFAGNDGQRTTLYVARSDDGGRSFRPEIPVAELRMYRSRFELLPTLVDQEGLDRLNPCPQLACDQSDGPYRDRCYLTWTDKEAAPTSYGLDVFLSASDDGGDTWGAPFSPAADRTPNRHQFFSALATGERGDLLLAWYDRREDARNVNTHYVFTRSRDGGASFEPERRLSAGPADFRRVGLRNGGFGVGDYQQLATAGDFAFPFWSDGRTNNGDVRLYAARLRLDRPTSVPEHLAPLDDAPALTIAPNPVGKESSLSITLPRSTRLQLAILDTGGRLMHRSVYALAAGRHTLPLPANGLPPGLYLCRVTTPADVAQTSFVVP